MGKSSEQPVDVEAEERPVPAPIPEVTDAAQPAPPPAEPTEGPAEAESAPEREVPPFEDEATMDAGTLPAVALAREGNAATVEGPPDDDSAAEGSADAPTPKKKRTMSATDDLLDELSPLSEKTVDINMADAMTREAMGELPPSTDDSLTIEGAPLLDRTEAPPRAPDENSDVPAEDGSVIHLLASLGEQRDAVFFRARIDDDAQPFTAVWSTTVTDEPPWVRLPDPRIVRPRARARLDRSSVRVFERPKGNTVIDYLSDPERFLPAMAALELGVELAEILESLHGTGQHILDLDPSQIVIEKGGRVRFYPINGFFPSGRVPLPGGGTYAAPEVHRGMKYLVGPHSDVYAVALLIWALLARRSPLEPDLDPAMLVSPRVFRPECPLGIWPYLRPCLEAQPKKRIGHARGLRRQLERARDRLLEEHAAADAPEPIVLEAWAERHIGLGKARRGSPQQDRALAVTDEEGQVGLYVIADGVSRAKFGDGAFAAEQVKTAAQARWAALEKAGPTALALSHQQRLDVLRQISRTAGKKICAEVNARFSPVPNEPNQVMSTTIAAAMVVGGEATVANLGDSRAYLIRDETIERISIDHDRCTDAIRMGLTFREASEMRMGSALTRVVGRVVIDDEGSASPDPFEPEMFRVRLLPGDRLVLCSDGVPDFAAGAGASQYEAELRVLECVLEHEDPVRVSFELVVLANRAGGYDNISCVVIAAHPG